LNQLQANQLQSLHGIALMASPAWQKKALLRSLNTGEG
jgi:hypothetical protein